MLAASSSPRWSCSRGADGSWCPRGGPVCPGSRWRTAPWTDGRPDPTARRCDPGTQHVSVSSGGKVEKLHLYRACGGRSCVCVYLYDRGQRVRERRSDDGVLCGSNKQLSWFPLSQSADGTKRLADLDTHTNTHTHTHTTHTHTHTHNHTMTHTHTHV